MPDDIPSELGRLIDDHVESLVQLETLLLLRRECDRVWTAEEVAKALYISRDMCDARLSDLERSGFLARTIPAESKYQYHPRDERLAQSADKLAELYQARRVAVIARIYSKSADKVRTFADAFRIRREE